MAKKGTKATRKFAASGQLTKKIQARRKHQQIQRKVHKNKSARNQKGRERAPVDASDREDEKESAKEKKSSKKSLKGMSVDDFLGAGFMEEDEDEDVADLGDEGLATEDEGEGADVDMDNDDDDNDGASFASVDELDDEGAAHMLELSKLAEKDPEFYKYLQQHDHELLEFNADDDDNVDDADADDDDVGEQDSGQLPVLSKDILRAWQKSLLETRSLRALRKLLVAFRSAVFMNEEDKVLAWTIDSPAVYDKLVRTALRYTPVVLEHHVPYKTLPNGRFKAPTQTHKLKTLQKLITSFFHNTIHILSQLSDTELLKMAVTESTKILPYVLSSRKTVKLYLKACLDLWSTADDSVRITTIRAMHRLASAPDESILDLVLRNTYQTLVKSSKNTTAYTLPSITFMKNSASEIFCLNHQAAYQHAFGFIRQLAIHLRNSMKLKTKESYKQVYNWQYVHAVDFWSLVLARACEAQGSSDDAKNGHMQPLIYPLVQIATGAIKLISHSRSYPFHLHLVRSLIQLTRHTHTYIPLAPHILPILTAILSSRKSKASTLRPLDFEITLRAPQQYLHTHVYADNMAHEAAFLTAEWLSVRTVHGSIAFPELVVPIVASLRRALKTARSGATMSATVKTLVERIEESARWISQRRVAVTFSPGNTAAVGHWEADLELDEAPLIKYTRVLRKIREKQRKLVEKARKGEDEAIEE